MFELAAALAPMGSFDQFVIYRLSPSATRPGKTDKITVDAGGRNANAHDPANWFSWQNAARAAEQLGAGYGVGFAFADSDPFFFLDIDNCLEASNQWSPLAQSLCQLMSGAAIEISQSGRGLHIFGTGAIPPHACRNDDLGLELYHTGRFVALTGTSAVGNAAADMSAALPSLVASYFAPNAIDFEGYQWTDKPVAEWRGPSDDGELIRRAVTCVSPQAAFGARCTFRALWEADANELGKFFPDSVRAFDANRADSALATHLAFWTGKDCARIERLMRASKLNRDKYDRPDYLPRTIKGVVCMVKNVYAEKQIVPVSTPIVITDGASQSPRMVQGSTVVSPEQGAEIFRGCVYVSDIHRALVPGGDLLKPDQFRVRYGGYTFVMDTENSKCTSDAWEAFTNSRAWRCAKVKGTCFRPDLPESAIITRDGLQYVNTYVPVDVPRAQGDASPFIAHVTKLLPNERDRAIILAYMAACVQHKGYKFQWAPLLQGVEGNGKTLLSRCVAEAVGRKYVHWPKASKLAKEFNAWMVGKVFYAVEDIYVPDAKREVIEELKPMITGGDGFEIEAKGVDQVTADICGNFMFNSNHKDAVMKSANDRRFCVLYSAQQQAEDLQRDGMSGDYMPRLYNWLNNGGYAIVTDFLYSYQIPDDLNPATSCQRAPQTSATAEAIRNSSGTVEQEIEEHIAQNREGFRGDFISSIWLTRLLEDMGLARKISHSRRREMLEGMGYIYHPALKDGRVNNVVIPDSGKPRLFVRKDSQARLLKTTPEVERAYQAANNPFDKN